MAPTALPRYFVARTDTADQSGAQYDDFLPSHIVDTFRIGARHGTESEWLVATDLLGNLRAIPHDRWDALPPSVRGELAYHEVSGSRKQRRLDVEHLFLFNMELLEQPADAAGWNDAVYLYGTLHGPYPDLGGAQEPGIDGQLTVARCDVLDGLARGAEFALRIANESGLAERDARCFHLLLPGDTEEATRCGSGLVLTYPLLPPEVTTSDVANEVVVARLIYDLLCALRDDLAREGVEHPLQSTTLPVPSRFVLEQALIADGYRITGDTAAKDAGSGHGVRGLLASAFGSLLGERVTLPPEGTVGEFLAIARDALDKLPGWPPARTVALRSRVAEAAPGRGATPVAAPPPSAAVAPPAHTTPQPVRTPTPIRVRETDEPPAWMRDFIAAHRGPGASPPKLTSTRAPSPSAGPSNDVRPTVREPEWIHDFDETPADTRSNASSTTKRSGKPDWMKDFD